MICAIEHICNRAFLVRPDGDVIAFPIPRKSEHSFRKGIVWVSVCKIFADSRFLDLNLSHLRLLVHFNDLDSNVRPVKSNVYSKILRLIISGRRSGFMHCVCSDLHVLRSALSVISAYKGIHDRRLRLVRKSKGCSCQTVFRKSARSG